MPDGDKARQNQSSDYFPGNPAEQNYQDLVDKDPDYVQKGLANAERHANAGPALERGNKTNPGAGQAASKTAEAPTDGDEPKGRIGRGRAKYAAGKNKVNNFKRKMLSKKWVVGGMIGSGSILIVALFLFILLGALKMPHVMENIVAYRGARVAQRAAFQNERTVRSVFVLKAGDSKWGTAVKERYANSKTKARIEKFDRYRPNKVIANLNANNGLLYNYDPKGRLMGITINNKTILTPKVSRLGKGAIPGYRFIQDVKISNRLQGELATAYRTTDAANFTRGKVGEKLAAQAGIKRSAWKLVDYKNKTKKAARIVFARKSAESVGTTNPSRAVVPTIQSGVEKVTTEQAATVADDERIYKAVTETDGVDPEVEKAVKDTVKTPKYLEAIKFANFAYAVALPLCIVYDGSINTTNTGETIDANSKAQQRSYAYGATVADQIKDGRTVDPKAVEAANDSLGDIRGTPSEEIAAGKTPTNPGQGTPQSGAGGIFTAYDAVFAQAGINLGTDTLNSGTSTVCNVLLDPYVAGGVAAVNVALLFIPGVGQGAAGAGKAATTVVTRTGEQAIARFGLKTARENINNLTKGRTKRFLTVEAGKVAALQATTILAQQAVASKAGQINGATGLEQGGDLVRTMDSGADLTYNEISRRQQNGRPLSAPEVAEANAASTLYVAQQNKQRSLVDRYASISNPNSLITRAGATIRHFKPVEMASSLLKPLSSITSSLNSIMPRTLASTPAVGSTYGNIQWGWPNDEIQKMKSDETYASPEENLKIIEDSGLYDKMKEEYGKCFSEDVSIGTLIQDGDIVFKENGELEPNQGDCAPNKLSYNNSEYGDLVFRWRIAEADEKDIDELLNKQEVSSATAGSTDGEGTLANDEIKIGSYNIQATGLGGTPRKAKKSLQLMIDRGVPVFGAQEVRQDQFDVMAPIAEENGYGSKMVDPDGRALFWDKSLLQLKRSGQYDTFKSGEIKPMQWGEFSAGGEKTFYIFNLHADPSSGALRQRNARDTLDAIERVVKDKASPVFIMGDMNGNSSPGRRHVYDIFNRDYFLAEEKAEKKIKFNCDTQHGKDNKNDCNRGQGSHIDHIWASRGLGIKILSWENMADEETEILSDHSPIVITAKVSGISAVNATGGGAGTPGAGYVGRDGFGTGNCVDYVKFVLRKHLPKYDGGSLGNGGDVAAGLGSKYGYAVNNTPAVHAVVSFPRNMSNPVYGHVAVVSEVKADGSIVIEEANWDVTYGYGKRTIPASTANKLLYAHTEVDWK